MLLPKLSGYRFQDGRSLAYLAVLMGHQGVLEILRDFKQDLTLANAVGWAPVHVAAMQGRIKTNGSLFEGELVILRDAGVDLNAKTKDGWTPAFLAAMNGHTAVLSFLLSENFLFFIL